MAIKIIVNSIGILLNIIGAYMVFINSPLNFNVIDGGNASTNWKDIEEKVNRKNFLVKVGVYILISGSVIQLVSNFIAG